MSKKDIPLRERQAVPEGVYADNEKITVEEWKALLEGRWPRRWPRSRH